ncbi:MAG: hypothetical protein R2860_16085 [Desulfobacterales bacterium]
MHKEGILIVTTINDIVLVYFEDQPFSFARVEEILPDIKRDWFHVKLLLIRCRFRRSPGS